jgi:hypothetical protein
MPVTWVDAALGKIHDREVGRQREGKARVGDLIVEAGDRPRIVDAQQVGETGAGRIDYKGEIVRRMRRGRDSQRNRYQQAARRGASQEPKRQIVRTIKPNRVSLLIDACSGVIPWLAVFLVAYASNMRVAFPPVASADLRSDPEEISPNAEEKFPKLDRMHLFRDFCMTARARQFNEYNQLCPLEIARNISIKAAFWRNAATDGDNELPECAPSRRSGPDFDLLIPGAGFSGAKGRVRPHPDLSRRRWFVR